MEQRFYSFENLVTEYKSDEIKSLTSDNMSDLKDQVIEAIKNRKSIKILINEFDKELLSFRRKLKFRVFFPFGRKLFKSKISFINEQIKKYEVELDEKKKELDKSLVELKYPNDDKLGSVYNNLEKQFNDLSSSEYIWDITTSELIDRVKTRSAASNVINRKKVNISTSSVDLIRSEKSAFHFQNANGGDIYVYPTVCIVVDSNKEFALIDYKDIQLEYNQSRFLEEEEFPNDATQIGTTWAKVNKDGSRDKRFTNNYEIRIALYGQLHWKSSNGFNEVYQFSNYKVAEKFHYLFTEYQKLYKST